MHEAMASRWQATARFRWLVWLTCVSAWTAALLVPIPEHPPGLPSDLLDYKFHLAKALHLLVYTSLTVLATWLPELSRGRIWLFAFLLIHAAGTELLQAILPTGREGCLRDFGIDLAGILLGVGLRWKWWAPALRFARPDMASQALPR
jgi:hypothetical protein